MRQADSSATTARARLLTSACVLGYLWTRAFAQSLATVPHSRYAQWTTVPRTSRSDACTRSSLGLLGMAIGELWWLDELAADRAQDRVFEFMPTSAPFNFDGFGSPANALAIKTEILTNRRML
jgi:hypothetical protein